MRSILAIQAFSALRESQKRYVFSGENVIRQGLGGKISSVAASHSLTLQNAFFRLGCPVGYPVYLIRRRACAADPAAVATRVYPSPAGAAGGWPSGRYGSPAGGGPGARRQFGASHQAIWCQPPKLGNLASSPVFGGRQLFSDAVFPPAATLRWVASTPQRFPGLRS